MNESKEARYNALAKAVLKEQETQKAADEARAARRRCEREALVTENPVTVLVNGTGVTISRPKRTEPAQYVISDVI